MAHNYSGGFIDPVFSSWATPLGEMYTRWLYADSKSNPDFADPSKWPNAGQVVFVDRSLNIAGLGAATNVSPINFGGGRNVVVFSRVCSVVLTTPAAAVNTLVLPNQLSSYVTVQQQRNDGLIEVETTPIVNVFGFGWSLYKFPVPEVWQGNQIRQITSVNASAQTVDIRYSWKIAYLRSGNLGIGG